MAGPAVKIWESARANGCWWFRLFGVGIAGVDRRLHPPLFSERYAGQHGIPRKRRTPVILHWQFTLTTRRNP